MECRICNQKTTLFNVFDKVARQVSVLKKEPFEHKGTNIEMFLCPSCNHYQIEYFNGEDYYDDYIMLPSADSIKSFRERQIKKLHDINPNVTSFIEIGCGDGGFLEHVSKYYTRVVGNEPSKIYNQLTKDRGYECTTEYITKDLIVTEKFDSFCAKQVFEHLPSPKETLTKIYEMLNDKGTGFIEIPNGAKTIYNQRYFDIFTDHVNYFTPASLAKLAQECGFIVVSVEETFGGDYLECYMKKDINERNIKQKRTNDINFIKEQIKNYKNIGAYGAGAKGYVILTSLDESLPLKYIFDDDPYKQNRYLPNTSIPVSAPNIENIESLDLIIIFAASYQDEIINKLKTKYNFKGDFIGLQNKTLIIK
jgi:cyclopropane fatty-acyl-phospholipid synthase-like methyltransferase